MKRLIYSFFFLLTFSLVLFQSCSKESASTEANYTGEELFRGIFLLEGEVSTKIKSFDGYRAQLQQQLDANPALADQMIITNDAIVNDVKALNPDFFQTLKAAVDSDNFNRVSEVIEQGALLMASVIAPDLEMLANQEEVEALLAELDLTAYDFTATEDIRRYLEDVEVALADLPQPEFKTADDHAQDRCLALWGVVAAAVWDVAAAVNYGVAINVGAAVNVFAYVYAEYRFWGPKDREPIDQVAGAGDGVKGAQDGLAQEQLIKEIALGL